jgi:hypothetical protein
MGAPGAPIGGGGRPMDVLLAMLLLLVAVVATLT